MDGRCRLCAEPYNINIEILEDTQFLSLIDYFFQLKVSSEDKLPASVCESCYDFVQRLWQFKEQVDRAQILLNEVRNNILDSICNSNGVIVNSENPDIAVAAENGSINAPSGCEVLSQESVALHDEGIAPKKSVTPEDSPRKSHCPKKLKRRSISTKKKKLEDAESFNEIDFVNPDGTVVPKAGVGGWNTYPWTCSECNAVYFETDELREHIATSHNNTSVRYLCLDCPKVYSKYISFVSHVKHHRPFLKYCCDVCYKWYSTCREVEDHQTTHNEEYPYHCNICGKRFRVQSLLNLHTRSHLPSDVKNCYACNHCPKKFGTKPNLMAHKRIHLGIKEYTCDQCGKSFVQKGNLDNHLLTHESARPYHCSVCDKSFKSLIRLRKHGSIHSGHKPHQCDICGRRFRERGTLKEHHRIHTGAMPFSCEFCGKCFRFKGVLTTHRRQHTGERPYSCTECQHHFTNWPNYNKHMKRRHGINTSVNCRTKQDIPPTGKPNRNPPGTVLAAPQATGPPPVICQSGTAQLEVFNEPPGGAGFYPVLGLYGMPEDIAKGVI